jgi:hypothetical protein
MIERKVSRAAAPGAGRRSPSFISGDGRCSAAPASANPISEDGYAAVDDPRAGRSGAAHAIEERRASACSRSAAVTWPKTADGSVL